MAIGNLELRALLLDLAEKPRVLQGEGRLGRKGLQELDSLRREFSRRRPVHDQPADEMVLAEEWYGQERAVPCPQEGLAHAASICARLRNVRDLDRLPG